jgi:Methyltransferase domain
MVTRYRTHSSVAGIPLRRKVSEWAKQFLLLARRRSPFVERDLAWLLEDVHAYDACARRFLGRSIADCRVLEIGFGARPYRLFALHAFGADVLGVDLDQPVLRLQDVIASSRTNGLERALKSAARYVLFDLSENGQLTRFLARVGGRPFEVPLDRLVVADASDPAFWEAYPGPYDFVYAEDVFEHIPEGDLRDVVAQLATHLTDDGVAVIRPMIWTGIKGGHRAEYFFYRGGPAPASVPPWEHLRGRQFAPVYLNKLTRRDYVRLFKEHLEIVEEVELEPDLGRELLTPELRTQLSAYDDYELFSNKVSFVLRRARSA